VRAASSSLNREELTLTVGCQRHFSIDQVGFRDVVHRSGHVVHHSGNDPKSGQHHSGISGQLRPELVDNLEWNWWTTSNGIAGQHGPEYARFNLRE